MNVIFLDYDGVVNIPIWGKCDGKWCCRFNHPKDNKVNNEQAVQWLSEFCEKYKYSIVVTSSWRTSDNYKECLINAGLREGIKILGRTRTIRIEDYENERLGEIKAYLAEHPETTSYIVIDDEDIDDPRFVKCECGHGFMEPEYNAAVTIHEAFQNI